MRYTYKSTPKSYELATANYLLSVLCPGPWKRSTLRLEGTHFARASCRIVLSLPPFPGRCPSRTSRMTLDPGNCTGNGLPTTRPAVCSLTSVRQPKIRRSINLIKYILATRVLTKSIKSFVNFWINPLRHILFLASQMCAIYIFGIFYTDEFIIWSYQLEFGKFKHSHLRFGFCMEKTWEN